MDHAITVGNVLIVSGVVVGFVAIAGLALLLLDILSPFRSGH